MRGKSLAVVGSFLGSPPAWRLPQCCLWGFNGGSWLGHDNENRNIGCGCWRRRGRASRPLNFLRNYGFWHLGHSLG